jgi:hypothetical protein
VPYDFPTYLYLNRVRASQYSILCVLDRLSQGVQNRREIHRAFRCGSYFVLQTTIPLLKFFAGPATFFPPYSAASFRLIQSSPPRPNSEV